MASTLKLDPTQDSAEQELEFEIAFQRSLTTPQRFEMMFARSRQIAELLTRYGHRRPAEVIKRP